MRDKLQTYRRRDHFQYFLIEIIQNLNYVFHEFQGTVGGNPPPPHPLWDPKTFFFFAFRRGQ